MPRREIPIAEYSDHMYLIRLAGFIIEIGYHTLHFGQSLQKKLYSPQISRMKAEAIFPSSEYFHYLRDQKIGPTLRATCYSITQNNVNRDILFRCRAAGHPVL